VEDDCDLHKYDYDKDREINRLAKAKALETALKDGTAPNWRPDAYFTEINKKDCPFFKPLDVIGIMEKPPPNPADVVDDSSSDSSSSSDEKKKKKKEKKKKKKEKKEKKKREKKEKKEKQEKNGWVT
jgi:hypothetical protein